MSETKQLTVQANTGRTSTLLYLKAQINANDLPPNDASWIRSNWFDLTFIHQIISQNVQLICKPVWGG